MNHQSKQLSAKQVQHIFDYTDRMHIKYKDVQFEIVDHIACGVEETMTANKELTFSKSLYNFTGSLPHRFLNDLVEEKEKAIKSYWNKKFTFLMLDFLSIPRIMASLIVFGILYSLVQITNINLYGAIGFCIVASIIEALWFDRAFKQKEKKFLAIKAFNSSFRAASFAFFSTPFWIIFLFHDEIQTLSWGNLAIAILLTSMVLFIYAARIIFPKKLKEDMQIKYGHLNTSLQ